MTAYEDGLLAAQFAALAPEPLEGRWDDVLREATRARDDRVRLMRRAAGQRRHRYLVVFAAVVVLVGMVTASALAVRAVLIDKGFIGLPPEGATSSTPESGDLVLDFYGYSQVYGGAYARVWVYADGRVVWDRRRSDERTLLPPEGANEFASGYLEQRLTPDGVASLRSEVIASGLFNNSQTLILPADYGEHPWGSVQVRGGGRSVVLHWTEPGWDESGQPVKFENSAIATPDQLSSLSRVDTLLTDPESVLPPSAWAERAVRAYVPSHFAVCLYPIGPDGGWAGPGDVRGFLSLLPAPAKDVLEGKSWKGMEYGHPRGRTGLVGGPKSCSKVTTAEAREVKAALAGFPAEQREAGAGDEAYDLSGGRPERADAGLEFQPYLPHGEFIDAVP
ncbi:MAG: hypothetical protein ACRDPV_05830 [Gaiellaceae bacterium]